MKRFALRGNICYSKSAKEVCTCADHYVVCIDGKSAGVFAALPQEYAEIPVVDCGDQLIIPGLVDLHIHAPQYAYRGLGMDLELMDWLEEQAFPEEIKYQDPEYAKRAYEIFAEQLQKSATTRACIFGTKHREATEILMESMEKTGLVSYVGKVNMDREAPDGLREESAEQSALETAAWIEATAEKFQHTKPILTPRFVPCCTDELMECLQKIQMKYNVPVQSHLSENQGEISFVHELRPQNNFYGEVYDEFGLFGKTSNKKKSVKTVMAHCVWSTEKEKKMMKENGVFVAHCPASNMNLSSGVAPIKTYLEAGLHVGLGSDVAGGESESIFRAMKDAIQVSKIYWRLVDQAVHPITFSEAFYMATKGGGEFFGKVGSFEKGYAFDAIVLDDTWIPYPQELTVRERLERAVYLALDEKGISQKYVDGVKILSHEML